MKAWLYKKQEGWIAKWSDMHSFTHGTLWEETLLHPDQQSQEFTEGQEVYVEFEPLDPEKPFSDFRARVKEPEISINEGNKIIAEFMGLKYQEKTDHPFCFPNGVWIDKRGLGHKSLDYNSSWDWLMPVLIKIEDELDVVTSIQINRYKDVGLKGIMGECHLCLFETGHDEIITDSALKIESLWKAIVKFIIWYNSKENGNR